MKSSATEEQHLEPEAEEVGLKRASAAGSSASSAGIPTGSPGTPCPGPIRRIEGRAEDVSDGRPVIHQEPPGSEVDRRAFARLLLRAGSGERAQQDVHQRSGDRGGERKVISEWDRDLVAFAARHGEEARRWGHSQMAALDEGGSGSQRTWPCQGVVDCEDMPMRGSHLRKHLCFALRNISRESMQDTRLMEKPEAQIY